MVGVLCPADIHFLDPARNLVDLGFVQSEPVGYSRRLDEIHDLASRETGVNQLEPLHEGPSDRVLGEQGAVCDSERDVAFIVAVALKDRLDERCVRVEVGRHDDDVAGLDARAVVEER